MAWSQDFFARLRRTLMRRGRTADDAEDLIQEAFLRFEQSGARERADRPEAFISRVAFNLAVDEDRRRTRSPRSVSIDGRDFADSTPGPGEVFAARERLELLAKGLEAVSPRSRRILLAQRVEGLSHAEIAAREGITVSAVEKQITRTILFLMEWMAR